MAIWTGTVAVTNGDATFVVDTGDALNQFNCTPDAMIVIDGVVYFVLSRTNTTSGELTRAYAGTTGTKAAEISPLNQTTTSVLTFSAAASRLAAQLEIFDKNSQGFFYTLIGATGDADPGAGNLAFDSIDFAALTEGDVMSIYLDNVDGNGRSVANLLDTLSAGTILVVRSLTSSSYVSLTLAGMVDGSGYRKSDATYIGHDGVLSAAEPVSVAYFRVGQGLEIDAQGNFAGRATHDAEAAGFTYLSTNGDGSSGVATLYRKVTSGSGDWSLGAVLQGPQGDQGDQGNQGIKGDAGVDGADGASAYDIAVAQGFVGSVSAWLASLEGADGGDGMDGLDGADGTDPGILLSWDEGTGDTNLGAGKIWADATLDLATTLFVSKTNRAGDDIGNWLLDLDASDSGIKGQLVITRTGGNAQAVINITVDGVDDRTGYVAINIADHSGADGFFTNDAVSLQFTRTGDRGTNGDGAGDVIGPAGGVAANEFVLFDGTTGKAIKGSGHYYGDYPLKTNNGSDFDNKRETKDNLSLRGTAIASATTTDLSSATGDFVHVTGTTTITGFGTAPAGVARKVTFDGVLTLTYNATSMILPGAGNIVTAAGDSLIAVSEGAGNWRVISYVRASGKAVVAEVTLAGTETLTNKTITTPVLTLEQGASVAPTVEGRIAWDTDDNKLKVGDGAGTKTFSDDSTRASVIRTQVFTSSGTYTPHASMLYCIIECVGGGGGGGGIASAASLNWGSAGGGGGGGYSRSVASAATIGASKTVTIGAAGSAGSAGNNAGGAGGDTSVGTICVGKGGSPGGGSAGTTSAAGAGGAGGVAGTGDFTCVGGPGTGGITNNGGASFGGGGGSSYFGGGAAPRVFYSLTGLTGNAGTVPGAGGGGGASGNTGAAAAGGAGAAGVVIITEVCSA